MAGSQTSQLQITGLTPGSLHHSYATHVVVSAHSVFSDNRHKQGIERVQALADILLALCCHSNETRVPLQFRPIMHNYRAPPTATSQLVTHTRLIIQSTRHKRAHNKTTSTSRNYLHAVRRHRETVLNTDGVITAICVTLMYTADYRSQRQITLLRKAWSTHHNAAKHDGQLVTRFYGVTS